MNRRLSLALPSKGRLREPSWSLLEASGVSPQERANGSCSRTVATRHRSALRAREDVPSTSKTASWTAESRPGLDIRARVRRRGTPATRLRRVLAAAAVSMEDDAKSIGDLAGRRIATSHPRIARRAWPTSASTPNSCRSRFVEISPDSDSPTRLSTSCRPGARFAQRTALDRHPLRIGAVLVGRSVRWITRLVARSRWCSGRSSTLVRTATLVQRRQESPGEVTALLPTTGSPTVMDLATPGIVAVHALVRREIWSLLPRLEAAGASSILTLPVERMCRE